MRLLGRRTSDSTAAYAPIAAFAATSILFFLGLVGVSTALILMLATAGLGELQVFLEPASRMGAALLAGFSSCALVGLGGLLLAGQAKAAVGSDRQFTVRSWPPWRLRSVDLGLLEHIGSQRGPPRRRGLLAATRYSTTLSLRDRRGAVLTWNPAFWRSSGPVVMALRAAAFDAGATVDPGALRVLDDPPFGGD